MFTFVINDVDYYSMFCLKDKNTLTDLRRKFIMLNIKMHN